MFCLYNKLYIFYNNFFFLNNYNYLNLSYLDSKKNKFNLVNNFILFSKISSSQKVMNKNNMNFQFKFNNKYYYNFNVINSFFLKKIYNMLSYMFCENKNILILDSNYKMVSPFYNFVFGLKSLYVNKEFFYLKKDYLTSSSWFYTYSNNIKKFGVKLLILLDYYYFKSFLTVFKKFNLPLISLVPHKMESVYLDYWILINYYNFHMSKFLFFNFFSSLFFKVYNFNLMKNKQKYMKNYLNFFNSLSD